MQQELAETVALQALGWLVGNDEMLPVFMGATGFNASDVRARAADPVFLGSVLEFLIMNDEWIIAFCDAVGLDYALPMRARQALPGGDVPDWT